MISLVHSTPVSRVHANVTSATTARLTLISMSLNRTRMFISGKIISMSAIGMSRKDFKTSAPAPPGPGLQPSVGLAMRYKITTSLNVGSWSSWFAKKFRKTEKAEGRSRRRVRRSTTLTSCLSCAIAPSAPSFVGSPFGFRDGKPWLISAIIGLGFPINASKGSISSISRSMSIFSVMNIPLAFATPFPRLKSNALSANCVSPALSAGFCRNNAPSNSLSNFSHAISIGRLNMKFSAFASSHSFCVSREKFASAMSPQKSVTKSTLKS
mmetsp:Transcript_11867/g.39448  ORF Transcript_11867/g.39448 Transcript_11867/m.39448 type:complete len:268 (+) Transcript_11867:1216-2019(+)